MDEILEIGELLLKRNSNWIESCKRSTSNVEYVNTVNVSDMAMAIRKAFKHGMIGDYLKSAEALTKLVNAENSERLKGYYKQLLAEYINFYDRSNAQEVLKSAKANNIEVLNPIEGIQFLKGSKDIPEQSRMII